MNVKHYSEHSPERQIAVLTRQLLALARTADTDTAAQVVQALAADGLLSAETEKAEMVALAGGLDAAATAGKEASS